MKQIRTEHGEVTKLSQIFNCSRNTIIDALRYRKNSGLSIKIRKAAIERGGVEVK